MLLQIIFAEVGMAREAGWAALVLRHEHRTTLTDLARSRTEAQREVEPAKVLLAQAQGKGATEIQRLLGVSRPTVYNCIDKPQPKARPPVRSGGARSAVEPRTTMSDASKLTPAAAYRASSRSNPMPQALSASAQPILAQNSARWDRASAVQQPHQQQAVASTAPAQPQPYAAASNPATWSSGGFSAVDQARGQTQAPTLSTARSVLRDIRESKATVFSVGTVARIRQGESGLGEVSDLQAQAKVEFSAGDGRMTVGVTPTAASAGTPDQNYGTLNRFGAGPAAALAAPTRSPGSQNDAGVGLQLAYALDNLKVDIGTRPLGFREIDIVGGVQYRLPVNDRFSISGELSRRAVTDSVLSLAGAPDTRTGFTWGGVSVTGGRLDATWDDGAYGVYSYGSLQGLTGSDMASNSHLEAGGGMYWRVHRAAVSSFTADLNATGISHDKNLRFFTYGHGGYFSPQQFLSLSVPLEWTQRSARAVSSDQGLLGCPVLPGRCGVLIPPQRTAPGRRGAGCQRCAGVRRVGLCVHRLLRSELDRSGS
jgi:hypothetical protein